jgi:hypothetical protein
LNERDVRRITSFSSTKTLATFAIFSKPIMGKGIDEKPEIIPVKGKKKYD